MYHRCLLPRSNKKSNIPNGKIYYRCISVYLEVYEKNDESMLIGRKVCRDITRMTMPLGNHKPSAQKNTQGLNSNLTHSLLFISPSTVYATLPNLHISEKKKKKNQLHVYMCIYPPLVRCFSLLRTSDESAYRSEYTQPDSRGDKASKVSYR